MCGVLLTWFLGRHNNRPFEERTNVGVQGSAVNTRVVKLLPLKKDQEPTSVQLEGFKKQGSKVDGPCEEGGSEIRG